MLQNDRDVLGRFKHSSLLGMITFFELFQEQSQELQLNTITSLFNFIFSFDFIFV